VVARLDKVLTEFDKADADNNGHIDKREWDRLELEDTRRRMADSDAKRDQERKMIWYVLIAMLLYPFSIIITSWVGLTQATESLTSIAGVYFVSASSLCAAFFGFSAMGKK
jgi:hypothetical protein